MQKRNGDNFDRASTYYLCNHYKDRTIWLDTIIRDVLAAQEHDQELKKEELPTLKHILDEKTAARQGNEAARTITYPYCTPTSIVTV